LVTDVREALLVELVTDLGDPIGSTTVEQAHTAPGRLHRAFSVMILDDQGRVLLQQRAAVKTRFALRWANACCGHPAPGTAVIDAATTRLREELGAGPIAMREVGVYEYFAEDEASGRVEYEYDHVLLARVPAGGLDLAPDPAEVAATRWVAMADLVEEMRDDPADFAPWLRGAVNLVLNHPEYR
jgi:isopentenyl-diphosphate delta-isomerase